MTNALPMSPLFAAVPPDLDAQTSSGSGPLPLDLSGVAFVTGAVALVLLVAMIVSSLITARKQRVRNSPSRLLRQLCDAHGFPRRQARLLQQAAMALGVDQPGRLFLEPNLLSQAAEHPTLSSRRGELEDLANELFGPAPL